METKLNIGYADFFHYLFTKKCLWAIACTLVMACFNTYGYSTANGLSHLTHSRALQASSGEQTNRIPLSNGTYQLVFMFSHFSKSSYGSPMSVMAENTTIVDDLRKYVPSQGSKSFSLTREVYITDGALDLSYSSGTADVLLTMLLKKTASGGSAPPPPPAVPSSGALITLVSPEKTVYSTDETITLRANIKANSGVSSVAFTINTFRLPEQTPAANATEVSFKWKNMTAGTYNVRAEAVTGSGKKIVTEPFTLTVETAQNSMPAGKGLQYTYYEGKWSSLPDFQTLSARKSGVVPHFTLSPREKDDLYGFRFSGFISIEKSGTYTFYTSSDDGSRLYINNKLLVDNDGLHGTRERSGNIYLTAGLHAIRVDFFENIRNETLTVSYAGPGIGKQEIPENVLFTSREEEEAETPPPAAAGDLPWLEDFNAADGSYKGSIEDAIYRNAIFRSENGKLTARGVGRAAWKSEVIRLNGQTADFSLVLSSVGNLENVDDVKVYYRLDQGAEVLAGEVQGSISGYKVISAKGLQGNNLQLIVRFRNSDISEHYFLDMVKAELSGEEQQAPPPVVNTDKYLINFGGEKAPAVGGWNNFLVTPVSGKKITLKNNNGKSTEVTLALESSWDDANDKGYSTGSNQGIFPDAVMQHYFYTRGEETIRISGLNSRLQYSFTFFASSMYDSDRTAEYLVGSQKTSLNASMNKNKTATLHNIRPDAQGNVVLKVRKADKASFGFLNALLIETSSAQQARQQALSKKTGSEQPQTAIAATQTRNTEVSIYPNPARQVVYINVPEDAQYSLYDTQGRLLSSGKVTALQPGAISLQGLPQGIYHIRLHTGSTLIHKKVFVQP